MNILLTALSWLNCYYYSKQYDLTFYIKNNQYIFYIK